MDEMYLQNVAKAVGSKIQVEDDRMDLGRNSSDEVEKVKEIKVNQEEYRQMMMRRMITLDQSFPQGSIQLQEDSMTKGNKHQSC